MQRKSNKENPSRRNILKYGAGIIGAGSLVGWLGTGVLAKTMEERLSPVKEAQVISAEPSKAETPSKMTPDQSLAKLMEGNKRFVSNKRLNPDQDFARLTEVAAGQAPFAAILSCSDSRVVPEIAFDQGIGDIFVVRVAGNVAMIEDIASQEFAVAVLKTPLLMVMGHTRCGAVAAAIQGGELPGVIESLVFAIQPAVTATEGKSGDRLTNTIKANVRLQMKRLENSSVISAAVKAGKLKVVGAYYDLDTGEVSLVS